MSGPGGSASRRQGPTRDHAVAEQSKNYQDSTAHHVVIDAETRRGVVIGRPLPGNRHDSKECDEPGVKAADGNTMAIADCGYQGAGLVMPHRRRKGEELPSRNLTSRRPLRQFRIKTLVPPDRSEQLRPRQTHPGLPT
ncbi:hypothetical protein [Streptomyces sp. Tue6028]|uniref:hypothetical protein n=1 Tax=Streptomyces sp. Tue6028 TaxID=2036037 RepID=UPI003D721472